MYLGIHAVIAKSFARIHRSNLINFGIIPFLFQNAEDYEKVEKGDRLIIENARQTVTGNQSYTIQNQTKQYAFDVSTNLNDREKELILSGGLLPHTKNRARNI
jgi:aconitate hydratase